MDTIWIEREIGGNWVVPILRIGYPTFHQWVYDPEIIKDYENRYRELGYRIGYRQAS